MQNIQNHQKRKTIVGCTDWIHTVLQNAVFFGGQICTQQQQQPTIELASDCFLIVQPSSLFCCPAFPLLTFLLSATSPCSLPLMTVLCPFTHTALITNSPLNYNPTSPPLHRTRTQPHVEDKWPWYQITGERMSHVLLQLPRTKAAKTAKLFDKTRKPQGRVKTIPTEIIRLWCMRNQMSCRLKTSKNKRGSCLEVTVCLGLLQTTGSQLFTMSKQVAVVFLYISQKWCSWLLWRKEYTSWTTSILH